MLSALDGVVDVAGVDACRGAEFLRIETFVFAHRARLLDIALPVGFGDGDDAHNLAEILDGDGGEAFGKLDVENVILKVLDESVEVPADLLVGIGDLKYHSRKPVEVAGCATVGKVGGEPCGPFAAILGESCLAAVVDTDFHLLAGDCPLVVTDFVGELELLAYHTVGVDRASALRIEEIVRRSQVVGQTGVGGVRVGVRVAPADLADALIAHVEGHARMDENHTVLGKRKVVGFVVEILHAVAHTILSGVSVGIIGFRLLLHPRKHLVVTGLTVGLGMLLSPTLLILGEGGGS